MRNPLCNILAFTACISSLLAQGSDDAGPSSLDPFTVYGEVSDYQAWPLSATAVSGEALLSGQRQNQRELMEVIPNMTQTDSGLRAYGDVGSVRGLTNTPFFGSPSIVQYVDDVPMGNLFSQTVSATMKEFTPSRRAPGK